MALFTKKQIDQTRDYLKQKGYPEISVDLGTNRRFNYFLVSQSLNSELPDFAMAMRTRDLSEGTLFGVSDSVPEPFRPYWAAHEYMETTEVEPDLKGRCLITLEKELLLVPNDIKAAYIARRASFFKNLVDYATRHNIPPQDIENFRQSLSKLEQLAQLAPSPMPS